jgi:outer membrane protein TolC
MLANQRGPGERRGVSPPVQSVPRGKRLKGWQAVILAAGALGAVIGLAGCTHSCFTPECDWAHVYRRENIPTSLEFDAADAVITPLVPAAADPATVTDAERTPHYLSLQEALAMALESGRIGAQSIGAAGQVSDDLLGFAGRGVTEPDSVRVLALDPAQVAAGIESALAKFDAVWSSGMSWNTVDQPTTGLSSFQNGSGANFSTTLAKPLPTGGVAGITFATNYQLFSNPPGAGFSVLNPSYNTSVQVGFEQPLLRGFGVDINEVLPGFPGAILFPSINSRKSAAAPEGILVSRLRFDQQRADFERSIHFQVLNVEAAYWNLYGAYMTMYAAEQGLRQSHAAWMISKSRFTAGGIDNAQYALVRAQYESFRAARMKAMGDILNFERALRLLLGMPVEDGQRLVPIDAPTMTPYQPNWQAAVRDCVTLRPELVMARQDLQAKELNLKAVKNALLPDLRFQASYTAVGLGTRLDGNGMITQANGAQVPDNSFRSLFGDHFNNWTMGLNLNVPLGFRFEYATTRVARLQLAQAYLILKDQEQRAQNALAKQYSLVVQNYKLIEIRNLARLALAEQLEARYKKYAAGAAGSTLEFLLDAQNQWATALSQEFQAVVDYNVALAAFEFARGTILDRNRVVIAEGPLPPCAQVRAVVHEKQRTRAVVLREQAEPVIYPPLDSEESDVTESSSAPLPSLPKNQAPSLPALLHGTPPAPKSLDAEPVTQVIREPSPPKTSGNAKPAVPLEPPNLREVPERLPPLLPMQAPPLEPIPPVPSRGNGLPGVPPLVAPSAVEPREAARAADVGLTGVGLTGARLGTPTGPK